MEDLLNYFQKQFLERISIKAGSKNETQVILQAFKYFDLNRSGTLDFDEFTRALDKLGARLLPDKELHTVFDYFDVDGNGSLNYREFSRIIFNPLTHKNTRPSGYGAKDSAEDNQDLSSKRPLAETLEIVREKVRARGAAGIVGLGRLFRIMDDSNSHSLEFPEFYKAMQEYRIGLADWEIRDIFDFFDLDQSGTLNYDEFLIGMRGPLPKARLELIDYVFDCLDKDNNGYILVDDIEDLYDTSRNKYVKSGEKTRQEVLQEFLENFEGNFTIKGLNDGKINRDEFLDYYGFISASIDTDEGFQDLIYKAWNRVFKRAEEEETKVQGQPGAGGQRGRGDDAYSQYKEDRRSQKNRKLQQILNEVREKLAKRGMRGFIGIQRQFRVMDEDNDGYLMYPEFLKAMKDFRLGLNDSTILAIFNEFDQDKNSKLDITEFNHAMVGRMNSDRRHLVNQVFDKLDLNGNGILSTQEVLNAFDARGHPDFKSGRMAVDSVRSDFIDTFQEHHSLSKGKKDTGVTREEFLRYYDNVSSAYEDDVTFERILRDCWRLDDSFTDKNNKQKSKPYYGKGRKREQGGYKYTPPWGVSEGKNDWKTSNEAIGNSKVKASVRGQKARGNWQF